MLALALTALLLPVASQPATASDGDEVTFTVGWPNEVDSFNIFKGVEASAFEMWALMYDKMVGYSMKDMSPVPELAESWDTSDDGLTWTFHIREGVLWSDGEPLTARDIAYTYNRVLDGGGEKASWGSYLTSVESVTAPDDTTVVLQLSKTNAVLPLLPMPILPEHIWSDVPEEGVRRFPNEPAPGRPVVGSGPFVLVEGTAGGSTYLFEKNENYWGREPHVDRVAFRVFQSEDPMIQALIKGEVDFVHNISPLQVEALQGRDGIHAINGVSPYFEEIGFNTGAVDTKTGEPIGDGNPALKDPEFRHALGYAMDQERLVENAYQGAAVAGQTIVPTAYSAFRWEPPPDQAFRYDPEHAGELLDAAGYEVGDDGFRTMPDGTPIGKLRLIARPEEDHSVTVMEFFSEWLGEIGIDSEVVAMESGQLTETIIEGNYDAFHWGWYMEPDPDSILDVFTCEQRGSYSDSWYCNEEYDRLKAEQNAEVDRERRVELIKQMQQILFEDSPYLVTAYTSNGQALRTDRFGCFQPQPDPGGVLLVQYGSFNYTLLRPADEAGDCDGIATAVRADTAAEPGGGAGAAGGGDGGSGDEDGGNAGLLVGAGVLVALLAAAGGFVAVRRRATADDRE